MNTQISSDELYGKLCAAPFIIAGPCVLESYELALETAFAVREAAASVGITAIFKSSFDKANRSSSASFRGPGLVKGLEWLAKIKEATGLPIVTDIHEPSQAAPVAEVADVLQIPAFLCRQTSLLEAAARTNGIVNIKKGQFVAPWDMGNAVQKVKNADNERVLLTERGNAFGYNNLVVDYRSFHIMKQFGVPVVFDATHSVQLPGGNGTHSGGDRRYVPAMARAAVAAGANGVFLECHPNPDKALCDGPNSWELAKLPALCRDLVRTWELPYEC